jgi:hypothetical protein
VPAADAGLGSGITNVSQQISGALGLALLGTVATNHTNGLVASHHGVISSLIAGYHLAFLTGAAAIAVGMLLALVLLRPREQRPALRIARAPALREPEPVIAGLESEREAA